MPTTKVMFYTDIDLFDCGNELRQNKVIEGIGQFLASNYVVKKSFSKQQAIKFDNEISINLCSDDFPHTPGTTIYTFDEFYRQDYDYYNYARLSVYKFTRTFNDDKTTTDSTATHVDSYYYFIDYIKPLSNLTLELKLSVDALNTTFSSDNDPLEYENIFSPKTVIYREHADRFVEDDYFNSGDSESTTVQVWRNIDFISENINLPLTKYRNGGGVPDKYPNCDWYLLYKANSDAIDTWLIPSRSITIKGYGTNTKTFTNLASNNGTCYFITTGYVSCEIQSGVFRQYRIGQIVDDSLGNQYRLYSVGIRYNATNQYAVELFVKNITDGSYNVLHNDMWTDLGNPSFTFNLDGTEKVYKYVNSLSYNTDQMIVYYKQFIIDGTPIGIFTVDTTYTESSYALDTIENVDRTESTLIKIIKLPYLIANDFGAWSYTLYDATHHFLKLNDPEVSFSQELTCSTNLGSDLSVNIRKSYIDWDVPQFYEDSKIYHSDFNVIKLFYDSFSTQFKPEEIEPYKEPTYDKIEFVATKTMNSRFMFKIKGYYPDRAQEDFPGLIIATRNNEIPIYNDAYMTYVKNGLNYDQKANEIAFAKDMFSVPTSIATGVGVGAKVGGVAGGIVGGVAGGAGSGISVGMNQESRLNSIQQKISLLKAQGISVAGCDDIDLMSAYCGNKLLIERYRPQEIQLESLRNLFKYYGYYRNVMGVPNIHSRTNWNYIQCDPIFLTGGSIVIRNNLRDLLKQKFNEGVSFIHKVVSGGQNEWDITQAYENWETWLYTQARG